MPQRSMLVTGASRGIGLGIAERLALAGHSMTITARDGVRLAQVSERLLALGAPRVVIQAGNLASTDDCEAVVEAHATEFGAMSGLILNAGVGALGSVAELPMHLLDKVIGVNLTAPVVLLQAALPLLRKGAVADPDRGAKVVALSSITAVNAEPRLGAYAATKAALVSLVDTLNLEESAAGVSATAVCPAYVDTDMSSWVREEVSPEEMLRVEDVVDVVAMSLDLSSRAVVSKIVISRPGTDGRRA